jgi:hypothetical protein
MSYRKERRRFRFIVFFCVALSVLAALVPDVARARGFSARTLPSIMGSPASGGSSQLSSESGHAIAGLAMPDALASDGSAWSSQKVIVDAGAQGDFFGWAVGISGHTAIVGAYGVTVGGHKQQGLAYIFTESDGLWTLAATLTANDGRAFDTFGSAVALSDGVAAVGAYQAQGGRGYVYVFTGSGSHWTQKAKLLNDTTVEEGLGWSVGVSGSTVLAGAPFAEVDGNQFGAVYAYAATDGVWSQTQELLASDGRLGDFFGNAIATDGPNMVIGADSAQIGDNYTQGAAYVFKNSGGTWIEEAKLVADDGVAFDNFGRSVAISGSTILAGAPYVVIDDNAFEGAVYVFDGADADWTQSQKLTAGDGTANTYFGWSVAVAGDNALVGATSFYDPDTGAAYVFARSQGQWTQTQELVSGDGPDPEYFGWSLGLSDTSALIGEPLAKVGGNYDQGASYFYSAPADVIFANGFE